MQEICSVDVVEDSFQGRTYDEDGVDERDCDPLGHLSQKGMHFINVNARSLLPKLDEIGHLAITSKAAVIAFFFNGDT